MNRDKAIEILTRWADDLQDALCGDCPYDNCEGREQGSCDRYYALEKIKEAGQYLIKHEQDTLKEFVEWYNCRLQKILEHEQELYDSATQQNHIENATFYLGEKTMLERLIHWLSQDLENFIKKREK